MNTYADKLINIIYDNVFNIKANISEHGRTVKQTQLRI